MMYLKIIILYNKCEKIFGAEKFNRYNKKAYRLITIKKAPDYIDLL